MPSFVFHIPEIGSSGLDVALTGGTVFSAKYGRELSIYALWPVTVVGQIG